MIICIVLFAGCDTGGGGSGDSTDPFGGGGGGGGTTTGNLTGTWTTISATGTVGYSNASLATTVNNNMTGYQLDDVITLTFNADKTFTMSVLGDPSDSGKYSMSGNTLTMTNTQNTSVSLNLTVSEKEFTCNASGTPFANIVAWILGEYVLTQNGYQGMSESGISVTSANLTLKFEKK
jgi:hypothetical protein